VSRKPEGWAKKERKTKREKKNMEYTVILSIVWEVT
jgi:hypothetical protein